MSLLQAVALAVVQGLTEFLPISSSGHLVVLEHLFHLQASEYLFFDVMLHLATLLAVAIFFHKRLLGMTKAIIPTASGDSVTRDRRWIAAILISTVITGGIGVALKDQLEQVRDNLTIVGVSFLFTGALLLASRHLARRSDDAREIPLNIYLFAVVMGLAQAVAILPGVSRSGSTVCTALLLGVPAAAAVEFSFLMSIPAILGAAVLELPDAKISLSAPALAAGFIVALISGLVFLWLLVWIVKKGRLSYFAYYVIPLGAWVLYLALR
ncbi:MAG: undecaprenyl-diphosphatase [bacterium]|nr:undecaprenyl-diphosphatase [bacterium]